MKKLINFKNCVIMGIFSNVMFILFILVCLLYYDLYDDTAETSMPFEITAFTIEGLGFLMMAVSIICIILIVRQRLIMKILTAIYLALEVMIMLVDFELINIGSWYDGYNKAYIICHAVFSALVCFSYILLDPKKTAYQVLVSVSSVIMMLGMFSIIWNMRIYISVLINTFAYLILYIGMLVQLHYEILEVDCYGDKARVQEFRSSFFD